MFQRSVRPVCILLNCKTADTIVVHMVAVSQQTLQYSGVIVPGPTGKTMAISSAVTNASHFDLAFCSAVCVAHTGHAIEIKICKAAANDQYKHQSHNQKHTQDFFNFILVSPYGFFL